MRTTDIFNNRSAKKINEAIETVFGQKLNLEAFTIEQLEDSRNRLRTQIYTVRNSSGFNETVENDTYTKAQWMLDAINAEVLTREELTLESDEDEYNDDEETESQGEDMNQVRESATDKASAVVTAKTMVDRVGRWIEELAGMENDTLLSLGDTIRDEMGQEEAKNFLSNVAPAIQQALQNLKATRETLATGVRGLTGEEQSAEIIGTPAPGMDVGPGDAEDAGDASDDIAPAGPDAMNSADDAATDEFAASEPATGGMEVAGRAQRESIDRSGQLLRVLAG